MLFFVLTVIFIAIGIVAVILYNRGPYLTYLEDWCMSIAVISISVAIVIGLSSTVCLLDFKYNEPYLVESMKTEKLVIEANIDRINEDKLPYTWSKEIADYNATIIKHKKNVNSPWLGIFHSKEIAEMEPIDTSQFIKNE